MRVKMVTVENIATKKHVPRSVTFWMVVLSLECVKVTTASVCQVTLETIAKKKRVVSIAMHKKGGVTAMVMMGNATVKVVTVVWIAPLN